MTTVSDEREEHAEFTELAEAHRDAVYRQMLRLCGNRADAEDVLTDALLTAYRRMETLREREAFGGWLAQIARRLCFRLQSRQRIEQAVSLGELEEHGLEVADEAESGPEELLLAEELRAAVRGAVEALSPEMRTVYVMRDLEERSGEETAAALGITLAAMKTRLHRARTQVREMMDALFQRALEEGRGR